MKTFLIYLAKKFKAFPYFGRQRFWFLYWAYKITGWHIRHEEWDFVLRYLPKLHNEEQLVRVTDVGCCRNLFCYEAVARGYELGGIDMESFDGKYPGRFWKADISDCDVYEEGTDFVTCISVLEHIGNNGYGDFTDQKKALENMCRSLKIGGRLLLTTPTREFAIGHPWHGFSWADLASLLPNNMRTIESTERAGQLCMALERVG